MPSIYPSIPSGVSYPAGVGLSYSVSSVSLWGAALRCHLGTLPWSFSPVSAPRPPLLRLQGRRVSLGLFSSLHLLLIVLLLSSNCLLRGKRVHVLVEYLHAYVRSLPRQPPSRQEAFLSMGNGGKLEKVQREGKTEHCWMNRKGSTFLVLKIKGRQLRGY